MNEKMYCVCMGIAGTILLYCTWNIHSNIKELKNELEEICYLQEKQLTLLQKDFQREIGPYR